MYVYIYRHIHKHTYTHIYKVRRVAWFYIFENLFGLIKDSSHISCSGGICKAIPTSHRCRYLLEKGSPPRPFQRAGSRGPLGCPPTTLWEPLVHHVPEYTLSHCFLGHHVKPSDLFIKMGKLRLGVWCLHLLAPCFLTQQGPMPRPTR